MSAVSRRTLITTGLATVAGVTGLAAAARLANEYGLVAPDAGGIYGPGEALTYASQRLLAKKALAREFPRHMISKAPFANEVDPVGVPSQRLHAGGFADWKLKVDGMVGRPALLSLADVRTFPVSRQITEVVCEEGWSYIAEWIGTPVSEILNAVGVLPQAKYLVYFSIAPGWWDSLDMDEALHPQTLLTWAMNDADLPVPFGGPLRMRVPRQIGYKSVKYITGLTVTDSLKRFGKGLGSASPEGGYSWYAGI